MIAGHSFRERDKNKEMVGDEFKVCRLKDNSLSSSIVYDERDKTDKYRERDKKFIYRQDNKTLISPKGFRH